MTAPPHPSLNAPTIVAVGVLPRTCCARLAAEGLLRGAFRRSLLDQRDMVRFIQRGSPRNVAILACYHTDLECSPAPRGSLVGSPLESVRGLVAEQLFVPLRISDQLASAGQIARASRALPHPHPRALRDEEQPHICRLSFADAIRICSICARRPSPAPAIACYLARHDHGCAFRERPSDRGTAPDASAVEMEPPRSMPSLACGAKRSSASRIDQPARLRRGRFRQGQANGACRSLDLVLASPRHAGSAKACKASPS